MLDLILEGLCSPTAVSFVRGIVNFLRASREFFAFSLRDVTCGVGLGLKLLKLAITVSTSPRVSPQKHSVNKKVNIVCPHIACVNTPFQ